MTGCSYFPSNWFYANTCTVCFSHVAGTHVCPGQPRPDNIEMRLSDEDIERIAQRVAELVTPKSRMTGV